MDLRRAAASAGLAQLLSRVTGLLREIAFAAFFGASISADAFNAAFRIGTLFRELFAEGALSNAFVPLYADLQQKEGQDAAFRLVNAFLGLLLVLLGGVTLLTLGLAEPLVGAVAGGFSAEKAALAAQLARILSPFVATISVAAVFMGMLNVRGRFFLPSASPALFNGLVIAACFFGDIQLVAWATLVGGLLQALVQLPALRGLGFRFRPTFSGHPALRRLLAFVVPALVAISVVQLNLLIETQLASRLGDGPVSWLIYAFRVAHLPFSVFSNAVGVASLAGLSLHLARGDQHGFRRDLASAFNLNSFLMIPSAVGLFLLAEPVVALLFERGAFTPEDTAATAMVLRGYAVAILGIGAQRILVPVFYALGDPRTPMWAGLLALALKVPVALALTERFGVIGLPLSHAVLVGLEVLGLLALLELRSRGLLRSLLGFHARTALAVLPMAGLVWWQPKLWVIPLSMALYAISAELVGIRELRRMLFKPKGLPPSVDEPTRALLEALVGQPVELRFEGDRVRVLGPVSGVIEARGGVLVGRLTDPEPAQNARPGPIRAVLRVASPPELQGLIFGDRPLRAEGERVLAEEAEGPTEELG